MKLPRNLSGERIVGLLPTLLAIWELARLSRCRGVNTIWHYAGSLKPEGVAHPRRLARSGDQSLPPTVASHPTSGFDRALIEADPDALQSCVNRWVARHQPPKPALATDGKRLRGANRQGEAHCETGSLASHANAMPIASRVYTEEGGEIAAVFALLEAVDVRSSMITLDAQHTTRNTTLAIRRRHGAHSLFTVKGNAPETFQTLAIIDWDRDSTSRFSENDEKAHGRIEQRWIRVRELLEGLINHSSVRQIFRIIRKRTQIKTDEKSIEVAYGMTSLPPEGSDAERLVALNCGDWVIEN